LNAIECHIECQNVVTPYLPALQRPALAGITCTIRAGEFVTLLGLNGAGKSTLLRTILGLIPLQQGTIQVQGIPVTPQTLRQSRRNLGVLFQGGGLIPQLSALDNVLCGRLGAHSSWQTLWGFSKTDRHRARELLAQMGLLDQAHQRTSRLSDGQQQRVAIARTLMQSPQILLVDEPIAGLDILGAQQVMETLAALNREQGITIVAVLHDLSIAQQYSDRAIVLRAGQIVHDGDCNHLPQQFGLELDAQEHKTQNTALANFQPYPLEAKP